MPELPAEELRVRRPSLRKLLVFQLKLYIDALRDLVMSPLSIVAFVLDWLVGRRGEDSFFEKLQQFGAKTERRINLFNQHSEQEAQGKNIDALLAQLEDSLKNEYQIGSVSASARKAIDKTLQTLRRR